VLEISIICVWLGCLSAYLSSENRKITTVQFKNALGWTGFIALILAATINSSMNYSLIVSILMILALIMLCWVCIVLLHGHKSLRVIPNLIIGSLFISMLIRLV
jgi:hypothetical protein